MCRSLFSRLVPFESEVFTQNLQRAEKKYFDQALSRHEVIENKQIDDQ